MEHTPLWAESGAERELAVDRKTEENPRRERKLKCLDFIIDQLDFDFDKLLSQQAAGVLHRLAAASAIRAPVDTFTAHRHRHCTVHTA